MRPTGTTPPRLVRRLAAGCIRAAAALVLVAGYAGIAAGQAWNSPAARALAEHATAVRAAQLADTGLRSYRAEARGYLTFLAQLGAGFPTPPKVVRTDQIASDVYWRAPDQSRQYIKGRRDTLLLPTDIYYHRDHLGIVQNNFPGIIRIGDGDEVADVPHPLSAAGLVDYDFAVADSLRIVLGPRTLDVYELRFRPRDPRAPRAVGSVYVDRASGAVVRMSIGFTRAALRDPDLEDISVVLENGLIEGRYWLPRRQEIEIRRTGTWLDYPARGIIRGRWEISDYEVNVAVDTAFTPGPTIGAAPGATVTRSGMVRTPGFHFEGGILDSLPPDVRGATSADVAAVRAQAARLVAARAVEQTRALALAGRSVSDFAHWNRVEGIALGAGVSAHPDPAVTLAAGASYGFSDRVWKPHASVALRTGPATLTLSGYRTMRDVGDVPERSGLANTLAAESFGSDATDLYYAGGGALRLELPVLGGRFAGSVARERQTGATVHASPASGASRALPPVLALRETRGDVQLAWLERPLAARWSGSVIARGARLWDRADDPARSAGAFWRGSLDATLRRDVGRDALLLRGFAAGVAGAGAAVPAQHLVYLGGPESAPGYAFHSLVGARAGFVRAEWRFPVPFIAIPLGAWGRAPATATLAPYASSAWVEGRGWQPSVGVGVLTLFDLLRIDVARGVRGGGGGGAWMLNVDVSPSFWPVL